MASIVDNPPKILSDSMLNDLKRKQTITGGDKITKKPRFEEETEEVSNSNGNHQEGGNDDEPKNTTPQVETVDSTPIDLSKINTEMEVDDKKMITPDDIRKLKELLRQEEAKLQLIKRIKASITLSEPANKPKVKNPIAKIAPNAISNSTSSNGTNGNGVHISSNSAPTVAKVKAENGVNENVVTNGISATSRLKPNKPVKTEIRSSSPVNGSTEKMITTSASFEKNRVKREQLKQQLNKTLNEITQTPPPPPPNVNFFPDRDE